MNRNAETYVVLARKYRPSKFSDVVGQQIFIRLLKNAISKNRVASGFLLTGIRGIGKTSIARLMAKAFNCKNLHNDIEPCNECESCRAIIADKHIDISEIDAASNTGVEDIRQIIESCNYKAIMGKCKIYIIDEVHMLSKSAFNALLKTLEEPPEHVKFILATTEVQKVPLTIVSRCLQFRLQPLSIAELSEHLAFVCNKEGIKYDDFAIQIIAKCSGGSARDSLSILEQAIILSYSNDNYISFERVSEMLGVAAIDPLIKLMIFVLKKNHEGALNHLKKLCENGIDPNFILSGLSEIVYHLSVGSLVQSYSLPFQHECDDVLIRELSELSSFSSLSRIWQMIEKGKTEMQNSFFPELTVKMLVLRMCYMENFPTPEKLLDVFSKAPHNNDQKKVFSDKKSAISSLQVGTQSLFDKAVELFKDNIA